MLHFCLDQFDIAYFKRANDTFENLMGDEVLLHLYLCMNVIFREYDFLFLFLFLFRVGGE